MPRKYKRKTFTSSVIFTVQGVEYYGSSENISAGGMFIRTNKIFPIGHEIEVRLHLKNHSEKETTLYAEVTRITNGGIGVRYKK